MKNKTVLGSKFIVFIVLICIILEILQDSSNIKQVLASTPEVKEDIQQGGQQEVQPPLELEGQLKSPNIYLINSNTQEVLVDRNSQQQVMPASFVKMMTILLSIEHYQDSLQEKITIPESIFPYMESEGASVAGFQAGEEVSIIDLLHGAMLPSGADATLTLAYSISGDEDNFAVLMNQKAAEIGLTNTHFSNSTGLDNPNQYSSAQDMAKLLMHCLENPTFKEVFTALSYQSAPTAQHPQGIVFTNFMTRFLNTSIPQNYQYLGCKTGYTWGAKACLASSFKVGETEYVLITMGGNSDTSTGQRDHVTDAMKVYEYMGNSANT